MPIIFTDQDNKRTIELSISGYEFPEIENTRDSNWLNISVRYNDGTTVYECVDPCIQSTELKGVLGNLNLALKKDQGFDNSEYEFLEPYLYYGIIQKSRKEYDLVISYSYFRKDRGDYLHFNLRRTVNRQDLAEYRAIIMAAVEKYPVRYKD